MLTRGLPLLALLGLTIYCLVECLSAPASAIRTLSRPGWLAAILLVPVVGPVTWLVAGRPTSETGGRVGGVVPQHQRRPRPLGPDDDPEFLAELGRVAERLRRDQGREPDVR